MKANQAAFEVGQLAQRMAVGYFAHKAAIAVATDPRAKNLVQSVQPSFIVPVGYVTRKDGTQHVFHFDHFLDQARDDPAMAHDFEHMWLAGSLLAVGDALSMHGYFDRAPALELVRHLRNGIAHGNTFRMDNAQSLAKFPAHNQLADIRGDLKAEFEITRIFTVNRFSLTLWDPETCLTFLCPLAYTSPEWENGDPLRR
jgi:hypothetical protein